MPYNNKSLLNLSKTGSKPGRKYITNKVIKDMTDILVTNHNYFLEQLHLLSPKDFVDAYLKLMKLVIPKNSNVATEPMEKPVWIIQLASDAKPTE